MVIVHTFLALAAGFAVLVALMIGKSALVARLTPSWGRAPGAAGKMQPAFAFVSLGASFLAAATGGYMTAWVAAANPLIHVLALAALSALQSRGKQPIWFQLAQVAVSPIGVLAGGLVRLRVLGIL